MTFEQQAVLSLLSGLIGALIGAGIVWFSQARDRSHREKGGGRAVYLEMTTNTALLDAAARNERWEGLSMATWMSQLPLLSTLLDGPQIRAVSKGYVFLPRCLRLLEGSKRGYQLTDDDRRFFSSTAEDFKRGTAVLRKVVWTDAELLDPDESRRPDAAA